MALASVISPHSKRNYSKALDDLFLFAAGRPLTRALLMDWRAGMEQLAASTINVRLSAMRKLVTEARRKGMLGAEEAASLTDIPQYRAEGNAARQLAYPGSGQSTPRGARSLDP